VHWLLVLLKKARPRSGDTILALLEKREIKIVIYRGNASINSVEVGQAEAGDQHITALSPFLQVCRYDFFFKKKRASTTCGRGSLHNVLERVLQNRFDQPVITNLGVVG
jgi:hypothetical protein